MGTDKLVRWFSEAADVAFPTCPVHSLLEQNLVNWQVMEGRYILIDIVARVVKYVPALSW